ncbi:hypothetical protein ACQR1I_27305 [Bradyrhizobium sp. HKCCYLS2038]|uniref:hypothetical protein n=1 Tax=unclassified Bradyrhizobium TaxID=2631580 RepID=UPI003EBE150E
MPERQNRPFDVVDDAAVLARKVGHLKRPQSYLSAPAAVVARETHMSWVFLAGDRVYKLKKPVRFPYLDFSTLERRETACRAEQALNRRLAPDVYIGLVPLTVAAGGSYEIDGTGAVADWLVVMRRLDEAGTLEAALRARDVTPTHVHQLAAVLHRFFLHVPRILISSDSYLGSLQKAAMADRRVLLSRSFGLPFGTIEQLADVQHRYLLQRRDVLAGRVRHRLIVDGHGDLRPEHIWLSPPFPIIDCLEFDARLRASDALDELSFLHLECERLGGRWVADALRRRLMVLLADETTSGLFLFYRIGRAMLRARLSIAHLADEHPRTPDKWPRLARTYLALARTDAARLERLLTS